jgi:hypothetical protein
MLFIEISVVYFGVYCSVMRNIFVIVVVILAMVKGVKISETRGSLKKK